LLSMVALIQPKTAEEVVKYGNDESLKPGITGSNWIKPDQS